MFYENVVTLVVWVCKNYNIFGLFNIYCSSLHWLFIYLFFQSSVGALFIYLIFIWVGIYIVILTQQISQLLRCQFLISRNKIIKYKTVWPATTENKYFVNML